MAIAEIGNMVIDGIGMILLFLLASYTIFVVIFFIVCLSTGRIFGPK